jgi:glucose/arabinose dehydrogenase
MAGTRTGRGYWLVASDGGVFAYGDARFAGSTGNLALASPIVAVVGAPVGGYWLMAGDGGVFAFGGAPFWGSPAATRAPSAPPIVGAAAPPDGSGYWLVDAAGAIFARPDGAPTLRSTDVVTGLSSPWDVGFLPDATLVFTEKGGTINAVVGGVRRVLGTPAGTFTGSEAGMLGLVVAPDFATSRTLYLCRAFTPGGPDVRVEAYTVNAAVTSATLARTLVTGLPVSSGRHSGCRPRFGADGQLYVGTGDAAVGTNPQSDTSLGGKVLRLDPATGLASAGNPGGFRWYTKGHRNVQGIAVQPGTGQVFSVEHGTDRDDEVNRLVPGGNGGWDPVPGYDETQPMTDLTKFPGAMRPVWASGFPTVACSGATFLTGPQWKGYQGHLVLACLKGQRLLGLTLNAAGTTTTNVETILGGGTGDPRMRTAVEGPDGNLYVATSNGTGDRIFRLTPS